MSDHIPLVDLKAQYRAHQAGIDAAIAAVIADAAFIGNLSNPYVRTFEEKFAAYSGAAHCIACANGTDSLEILLQAAGIGPGDEVVVPAVSWIATSEAVSNVGARPVFADIDARTCTLSPSDLARKVGPKTKGVIPVHLYGQPADMDPILSLARERGLFVLEDCAQAHGAKYKGRPVGTLGNAGSFSFFPGKNLGAYGDAGGMVTGDAALAARARMISQHGQAAAKHDHQIEGRNSRMDGINAAVLSAKLPHLSRWIERRREIAAAYRRGLGGLNLKFQESRAEDFVVHHLFTIQLPQRDDLAANLKQQGIATAVQYPKALPFLTAYGGYGHKRSDFPAAAALTESVLSLPLFPEMTDEQVQRVIGAVTKAL